jgi:hypothetical protein
MERDAKRAPLGYPLGPEVEEGRMGNPVERPAVATMSRTATLGSPLRFVDLSASRPAEPPAHVH